ncbi:hypothetical protein [Rubellimicrobium roseum]|uniref:Uncharacterized protein n=1 Tax=Rubellimicrobium roseum TaxID=687525 RepID=A0A5C4ND92_9RHOB|nr:hypothetical protein [Rubellimicrobium roseum]TNC70342.1 hypothetical protein FHG71_13180 [Rubellimicrobium roseum]
MTGPRMDNFRAVMIAEGVEETDDRNLIRAAWQHLHDTGLAEHIGGWLRDECRRLLAFGVIAERRTIH